jgi:hypothetical protein
MPRSKLADTLSEPSMRQMCRASPNVVRFLVRATTARRAFGLGAFANQTYGRPAPLVELRRFARLHQLSGPVGRSINVHKTDIKSLSSRDAARRAEVVRDVSSTISIKCPTRSTKASPITR